MTSRRFCDVCAIEHKGADLLPRVIVAGALLAGVAGVGSMLRPAAPVAQNDQSRAIRRFAETQPAKVPVSAPETTPDLRQTMSAGPANQADSAQKTAQPVKGPMIEAPQPSIRPATSEAAYMCGAETKKGTPCSRRVKGNVRCFQHIGMPAMVPASQLKIGGQ